MLAAQFMHSFAIPFSVFILWVVSHLQQQQNTTILYVDIVIIKKREAPHTEIYESLFR